MKAAVFCYLEDTILTVHRTCDVFAELAVVATDCPTEGMCICCSSFIMKRLLDLKTKTNITLVAMTSMSISEYRSLSSDFRCLFKYALLEDGAVLLVDDKEDIAWLNESYFLYRYYMSDIYKLVLPETENLQRSPFHCVLYNTPLDLGTDCYGLYVRHISNKLVIGLYKGVIADAVERLIRNTDLYPLASISAFADDSKLASISRCHFGPSVTPHYTMTADVPLTLYLEKEATKLKTFNVYEKGTDNLIATVVCTDLDELLEEYDYSPDYYSIEEKPFVTKE